MKPTILPSFIILLILLISAQVSMAQLQAVGGINFDFGRIYQTGAKVHKVITLENIGSNTISIKTVHTSCGCTAALLSDSTLGPGKKTELNVTFDPTGYIGEVTKYVYIVISDTANQLMTLKLSGYVAYALQPTPGYVLINNAKLNQPDSTTVTLSNTSHETFRITRVECDSKGVSFKLNKKKLKPGEFSDLVVYITPREPGEISGFIHVYTTSKLQPELQLRLVAGIVGN